MCYYAHGEPFVPHKTMLERMVGSTCCGSNVYEVVDGNSNPYRTMVMNAMRMNQDYDSQCSIVDVEPHINAARFFLIF
jgi:hypothetical protein